MIWYALLIPLIVSGFGYFCFKKQIVPWELFVPVTASLIVILISFYSLKSYTLKDVEYNGYVIVEARYYESWSTWVDRTCYTTCCCNSKGENCQQVPYDCSYCDNNSEYYEAVDSGGNIIRIDYFKYKELQRKWKATPQFNELNRNIDYHGGCGKDGDMYSIVWDGHILSSETSTFEKSFTNILKCNHSAFNFPEVTPQTAKKYKLYEYPDIYQYQKQAAILGLDRISFTGKNQFRTRLEYLNGKLGKSHKVRIFTLLFKDTDINAAFLQEAYWDGGNQNELVVCIGVDKLGNISWVKPFSWCDNKRIIVDTREDLMEMKKLDPVKMYDAYQKNVKAFWHYKSFKDFNYLSFEPTKGQLIFVYLLTFIISIGTFIWCIKNGIDDEQHIE